MIRYIATINDVEYLVELLDDGRIMVNDEPYDVDFESVTGLSVYSLLVNNKSFETHVYESDEDTIQVLMRGTLYNVQVEDEREKRLREVAGGASDASGGYVLKAPMPGLVVKVPVKQGDTVEAGAVLLILESMKMQNELKTPVAGTVSAVNVKEGDSVEQRFVMIEVEE
jgi:biotin carboxyl carrier protein